MKTGALIWRCARCQESVPAAGEINKKQISPTKKSHGITKWAEAVAHFPNLTHLPGYTERNKKANFPPHVSSVISHVCSLNVFLKTGRWRCSATVVTGRVANNATRPHLWHCPSDIAHACVLSHMYVALTKLCSNENVNYCCASNELKLYNGLRRQRQK